MTDNTEDRQPTYFEGRPITNLEPPSAVDNLPTTTLKRGGMDMVDSTEDQQPTVSSWPAYTKPAPYGWQPDGSYITPSTEWFLQQQLTDKPPTQPSGTDDVPTDWVRQRVLNSRAKGARYEEPLGQGWTTSKLAPPPRTQELATKEYVDQQIVEALDSIQDSMVMSAKWVNRRIAEEIAKEKAAFYRFLLRQAVCLVLGLVIGWLMVGWLWG